MTAAEPPQAAPAAASSGRTRGASLSLTSWAPAASERAYLDGNDGRQMLDGNGDRCSTENFSSLPVWIRTNGAPSDLENFGGQDAAFIWQTFLQAVGIENRL